MDKRILLVTATWLLIASGIFVFRTVSKGNETLAADFTCSSLTVMAGDSVEFADITKGGKSWRWDFGDKEFGLTQKVKHAYVDEGTYNVTLTVTGSSSNAATATRIITVQKKVVAPAPVATETVVPQAAEPEKKEPVKEVHKEKAAPHHQTGKAATLPEIPQAQDY